MLGELYCLPGNAGIAQVATCVPGIGVADVPKVTTAHKEETMESQNTSLTSHLCALYLCSSYASVSSPDIHAVGHAILFFYTYIHDDIRCIAEKRFHVS
jgi:hypothetical protein